MAIIVHCPDCYGQLKLRDNLAGRTIGCPKCKAKFTVDGHSTAARSDESMRGQFDTEGRASTATGGESQFEGPSSKSNRQVLLGVFAALAFGVLLCLTIVVYFITRKRTAVVKPTGVTVAATKPDSADEISAAASEMPAAASEMPAAASEMPAAASEMPAVADSKRSERAPVLRPAGKSGPPDPPVYVPLLKGNTVDLYEDPPIPSDATRAEKARMGVSAKAVNPQRVQVVTPDEQTVLLLPFARLNMGEEAKKWYWHVTSTHPPTYVAEPRARRRSGSIELKVLPNQFADVETSNEAKRLTTIDEMVKTNYRFVKASEMQAIGKTNSRFQFYAAGGTSRHDAFYIIHDEDRVLTFRIHTPLRSSTEEVHKVIAMCEWLGSIKPGNVPANIQTQLQAVVDRAKTLIAEGKGDQTLRLLFSDEVLEDLDRSPGMFERVLKQYDGMYKPKLIETFELMDYSTATYEEAIDRVSFPYKSSDIIWEKNGDRWVLK